jgi:endogenous inhibitor of DNA gyrase (YacG/DUF329 family)
MALLCPTCKKPVREPAAGEPLGAFPFCCERCKLIDLGRWLDGKYQIPVVEAEDEDGAIPPAPQDDPPPPPRRLR